MLPLKNETYHVCELEAVPDLIMSKLHPNASFLKKFWARFKHWMILNPSYHRSKDFFRSRYTVMQERKRHLLTPSYRFVIHPFSSFAQFREIVMMLLWSVLMFLDPFMGTFVLTEHIKKDHKAHRITEIFQATLGVIAGLDIITNFFMGYANNQTREVILEPRKIVKRYMLSFFLFDAVALAHAMTAVFLDCETHTLSTELISHQLYVCRLARLITIIDYSTSCFKMLKMRDSIAQCLNILFSTVFILHEWTCILCIVPLLYHVYGWDISNSWTIEAKVAMSDDWSISTRYIRFLLVVMCHFYGASRTSFWSTNAAEVIVLSCIIVCGVGYFTYAVAVVGQLFRTANISEMKYDELVTQLKQYAQNKKLPVPLKNRLLTYYESKFQRKFFQEQAILQSLSEHLRLEVTLYSSKHLIESVTVFQGLSKSAIGTLLSLLRQEIFLPGDKITSSLDVQNNLYYFVSYGTVACIVMQHEKGSLRKEKIEVMHFEDGDYFGENDQINAPSSNFTYIYYMVAIELSEIFILTKQKLLKCKEMFPEFAVKLETNHQKRKVYIGKFLRLKGEKTDAEIMKQLSHGRVLLHGRKRRR